MGGKYSLRLPVLCKRVDHLGNGLAFTKSLRKSKYLLKSPPPPTSWWSLAKPTGPLSRNSVVAERKVLHRSWKKIAIKMRSNITKPWCWYLSLDPSLPPCSSQYQIRPPHLKIELIYWDLIPPFLSLTFVCICTNPSDFWPRRVLTFVYTLCCTLYTLFGQQLIIKLVSKGRLSQTEQR